MDEVAIDSSSGQQQDEKDQDGVVRVVPAKKKLKAAKIDHTYRDYSQRTIPPLANSSGTDAISSRSKTARSVNRDGVSPKKKQTRETFPATLHKILCRPEYRHIICWMPHGRSWTVVDKDLLAREVCPTYFAHDKFESFNRSVNGWGFKVRCYKLYHVH